ncbi:MAG TPA: thioredoxin domain-containing protein [Armatimonadota bacterium]|nr:thioredoxin domain-containing protein [Armatimonadota bacterium]
MTHRAAIAGSLVVLVACSALPAWGLQYTIAYTGETHSMVGPCNCPIRPDGGVARRATMLRQVRKRGLNPVLVVDAGGLFAGGPYDEYTLGPVVDRERTLTTLRAMALMGYDAVGVGDEELAYGADFLRHAGDVARTTFVSANLCGADGRLLLPTHVVREVGGLRFGIIGATPDEAFLFDEGRFPDGLSVSPPIPAVRAVVEQIRAAVDVVVLLSHLGETTSRELLQQVGGIDVLINAHRMSSEPGGLSDVIGGTVVAHFSYQGRALGRIDFTVDERHRIDGFQVREMRLSDQVESDAEVGALVDAFEARLGGDLAEQSQAVVDLYVTSECPHCRTAQPEVFAAVQDFGPKRVVLRRHYVVHAGEDGALDSGTEPAELLEDRRQACIERVAGPRIAQYLMARMVSPQSPFEELLRSIGVDADPIERCVEGRESEARLLHDAELAKRFRIRETPTLLVNGTRTGSYAEITRDRMLTYLCSAVPEAGRPEVCSGLPQCFDDRDCRQTGKIGRCVEADGARHCEFEDPIPIQLTVLTSPEVRFTDPGGITSPLAQLLPGVQVRTLDAASDEGRALIASADVRWLPAFFLDRAVEQSREFASLQGGLLRKGELYQLEPYRAGGSLDITRPRETRRLDLFLSPLDPASLGAAARFVRELSRPRALERFDLNLRWVVYQNTSGALAAPGGPAEVEEAARQAFVRRTRPELMADYLDERAKVGNSSYWDVPVRAVGLDPETVRAGATQPEILEALMADARARQELNLPAGLTLLVENRELVDLHERGSSPEESVLLTQQRTEAVLDRLGISSSSLTIAYAGHLNGQLEACGCPGNPFGGVAAMASALRDARQRAGNFVFLSAGDMLPEMGDPARTTALLRALESMGLDALGLGDQELALGSDFVASLGQGSPVPVVSANLSRAGEPLASRHIVLDRGLLRIGVFSVLAPEAFAFGTESYRRGIEIEDPISSARREAHVLRGEAGADVVVALSHLGAERDRELARMVPGIDVVIGAHTGRATHAEESEGTTILVEAGRDGQFLGLLHLTLKDGAVESARNRLVLLDDSAGRDEAVQAIVADYKGAQEATFAGELAAAETIGTEFRPASCGACHAAEYEQWRSTGHGHAMATLASVGEERNPDCWQCHSAPVAGAGGLRLQEVHCLACHDVGGITAQGHDPAAGKPVETRACLPCHTPLRSPNFEWDRYRPFVAHKTP